MCSNNFYLHHRLRGRGQGAGAQWSILLVVVMATLEKRKQTKDSIMVFSSISKQREHLR
jgi:hypothetical protein